MALAYSYIRFSARRQEKGDSIRRQTNLRDCWLKRHPEHALDTGLRLADLGKSAFHGANLDKNSGDLGKFVHLVHTGKIPSGSILILENLDRFSRQQTRKAYRVFCDLVDAGIVIQTLAPEMTIDSTNIDDMQVVLPTITYMQLAHEYSRGLSRRVSASWDARRKKAASGQIVHGPHPAWLSLDRKTSKFSIRPEGRKALNYIFARSKEGCGTATLCKELNAKFKPLGKGKWNEPYIRQILTNRAVLGEFQPCTREGEKKVPCGPPVKDYYPRMISDELFYAAKEATKNKAHWKGSGERWVNPFGGLLVMPDGSAGHPIKVGGFHKKGEPWHYHRRIVSFNKRCGMEGACQQSVDYDKFENAITDCLSQLTTTDFAPPSDNADDVLVAELEPIQARIAELEKSLVEAGTPVPQVVKAISELNARAATLEGQIEALRAARTSRTPRAGEMKEIMEAIRAAPEEERNALRIQLRSLVSGIVERIELFPTKADNKRVGFRAEVKLRNGECRRVNCEV